MGKKSRKKMTGLTEEQRIERYKEAERRSKELESEKVKALSRAILRKIYESAEAREELVKVIKESVKKDENAKD